MKGFTAKDVPDQGGKMAQERNQAYKYANSDQQ